MPRRYQFSLRRLFLAAATVVAMRFVVFPIWRDSAARSAEQEHHRRWQERFVRPAGWEPPPGWHIDENGHVVADNADGNFSK